MEKYYNIDNLDLQIMSILLEDAKIPYTEIGKQLDVSGGTIHVRIKKLEALGVIKSATLNIDLSKLGISLTAFLGFLFREGKAHKEVIKELKKIKEIVEVHYTTGRYHMFAKIVCKDAKQLKDVLIDKINSIDGIEKTETNISLGEIFSHPVNLVDE